MPCLIQVGSMNGFFFICLRGPVLQLTVVDEFSYYWTGVVIKIVCNCVVISLFYPLFVTGWLFGWATVTRKPTAAGL